MDKNLKNISFSELLSYENCFLENSKISSMCIKKSDVNDVLFSIVIPTYQRVDLLEKAIDSALYQKGNIDYEVVVVDNNSKRYCETEQLILKKYSNEHKLSYYKNRANLGMFGNWNRCYELAKAELVCMLHDDDILKPHYLEKLKEFNLLECYAGVTFRATGLITDETKSFVKMRHLKNICGNLSFWLHGTQELTLIDFCYHNPVRYPGMVLRKSVVKNLGGFSTKIKNGDYVFWFKLMISGYNLLWSGNELAYYRYDCNESIKPESIKQLRKLNEKLQRYVIQHYASKKQFYFYSLLSFFEGHTILKWLSRLIKILVPKLQLGAVVNFYKC